jgi:hypothetical protein
MKIPRFWLLAFFGDAIRSADQVKIGVSKVESVVVAPVNFFGIFLNPSLVVSSSCTSGVEVYRLSTYVTVTPSSATW